MHSLEAKAISDRINNFGRYHTLEVANRRRIGSLPDEIDNFAHTLSSSQGIRFKRLSQRWREIDCTTAAATLCYTLSHDLAYDSREIPDEDAKELTKDFLGLFDQEPRYFTSGRIDADGLRSWNPLTNATFDTGIVVVDDLRIGIAWCHDED